MGNGSGRTEADAFRGVVRFHQEGSACGGQFTGAPPHQALDPPQMSADLLSRYYCSRLSLQSLNKTDARG